MAGSSTLSYIPSVLILRRKCSGSTDAKSSSSSSSSFIGGRLRKARVTQVARNLQARPRLSRERYQPRACTAAPQQSASTLKTRVIPLLSNVFTTCVSLALLICTQRAVALALSRIGSTFPPALGAMLLCLSTLTILRVLRLRRVADSLSNTVFGPGVRFLTRWLAVFFVPNLVMLPLAPELPRNDLLKIGATLVCGLVLSLFSAAIIALLLRTFTKRITKRSPSIWSFVNAPTLSKSSFSNNAVTLPPSKTLILALFLAAVISLPFAAASSAPGAGVPGVIFALCSTLLTFSLGQRLPSRIRAVVHPLVSCTLGTLASLSLLSSLSGATSATAVLSTYLTRSTSISAWGAGDILAFLLGPAVVSFAFTMDARRGLLRARASEIVGTSAAASVLGLYGTAVAVRKLQMSGTARVAMLPRMITAPLAVSISSMIGAQPGLALSIVALTGLLGANIAAAVLSAVGIRDPAVRGLATGAAAHGLGTAAMADEPEAFPFAALAMTLVGVFSTLLVAYAPARTLLLEIALGGL